MKKITILYLLLISLSAKSQIDYTHYVDPFIGTGGHGHTYPGATVPFGMVQLSPDSRIDASWDGCGGYHYDDSLIYGFSHTHLSGTGVSDYGDILLFPISEKFDPLKKYSSHFDHSNESASPGYYSVFLKDQKIRAELTATARAGFHQYTFDNEMDSAGLIIDLRHRDRLLAAEIYQIDKNHLAGYRRSTAWAVDQIVYFYMEFDHPVEIGFINSDSTHVDQKDGSKIYSGNIYTCIKYKLSADHKLKVKVSLSAVDAAGAQKNMKAETPGFDFNNIKNAAINRWNNELGKIEVKGGTEEQYKIFYTALYHCMVVPNIYNDFDGRYLGRDLQIHDAKSDNYTVFSLWDTFRAWHPLMTIIDQKRTLAYVKTFLRQYETGGMLPVWELAANETECMIGYHSVSVITDAYVKGIKDFNTDEALNAMRKSAEAKGRFGLGAYMDHGYLDVADESESVSKTLEYSYDDWCISKFASLTGRGDVAKTYLNRSNHWKNLFDTKTQFIRPKKNGSWLKPFEPREVNNNYTEANAWQYTFFVPHDINGLACKMGGIDQLEKMLDQLFTTENKTTGREQADITGLIGQYAHGNEPSHHMAYLYNFTDHPWKTQMRVTQILKEMYHALPDGLIGNEDCGQMSAWFVMSAMGIYDVCPGDGYYMLTTPLFDNIIIHLESGNTFTIRKENISPANQFIQEVSLNNHPYSKKLAHSDLMNGGDLVFKMGEEKKEEKIKEHKNDTLHNSQLEERLSRNWSNCYSDFITSPVIDFNSSIFKESTGVNMTADEGMKIYFTLDGKKPDTNSTVFVSALKIDTTVTLKAIAYDCDRKLKSYVTTSHLYKMLHPEWKINIQSKYSPQYNAGGDEGIIDGLHGDIDWRKGGWQGYQGQDFEAIVDFGKETLVSSVSSTYLQDTRSWILMPLNASYELSSDGINFKHVLTVPNTLPDTVLTNTLETLGGPITPMNARYLKVKTKYYGHLPEWHQGAGGEAYIFIDEIEVH